MQADNPAPLFAALGDPTRLDLIARLGDGADRSIAEVGQGLPISRQAVTKHLDILHRAGLVRRARRGRETRYALQHRALADARAWLDRIDAQWDDALARLRDFVEQ